MFKRRFAQVLGVIEDQIDKCWKKDHEIHVSSVQPGPVANYTH